MFAHELRRHSHVTEAHESGKPAESRSSAWGRRRKTGNSGAESVVIPHAKARFEERHNLSA